MGKSHVYCDCRSICKYAEHNKNIYHKNRCEKVGGLEDYIIVIIFPKFGDFKNIVS